MGIKTDYSVLALPEALTGSDVYLRLPAGFHVDDDDKNRTYLLNLKKNLYGTSQAAENWFDMLKNGLEDEGLKK